MKTARRWFIRIAAAVATPQLAPATASVHAETAGTFPGNPLRKTWHVSGGRHARKSGDGDDVRCGTIRPRGQAVEHPYQAVKPRRYAGWAGASRVTRKEA